MLVESPPSLVEMDADNSDRICPIFAGPALIAGNGLKVRLAHTEIAISAPSSLLKRVYDLCDGTRSISDTLLMIRSPAQRDKFEKFLQFLLDSGVLIDAAMVTFSAARYGWMTNAFGQASDVNKTNRIGSRFYSDGNQASNAHYVADVPLRPFFEDRTSNHYFDDEGQVSPSALNGLLWSIHGVVRTPEQGGTRFPRRTIASAGAMHLLESYVVMLRPTTCEGGIEITPGVYRVHYPEPSAVAYELISHDTSLLWRSSGKPWYLASAWGAVFLTADESMAALRYRNRALQYLYMEAGAALHNGALSASQLNLGYTHFGSFSEIYAQRLLQRPDRLIVGCALFGAKPNDRQSKMALSCPPLEFAWADADSEIYRLPYYVAQVKNKYDADSRPTWGRDSEARLAARKAVAEHIERDGYATPRNVQTGLWKEMEGAIDPYSVARYSAEQPLKRIGIESFNSDTPAWWVPGTNATNGTTSYVLSDFVYSVPALQALGQHNRYWHSNSSGCAAGTTMLHAQEAAVLELLERDAFMRHWLSQEPGWGIESNTLPRELGLRVDAITATGFEVSMQRLPSPLAQVAFLFARHPMLRTLCVAASARATLESALDTALVELECRVFTLLHGHLAEKITPRQVNTPDDHFDLYSLPRNYHRADALATPKKWQAFQEAALHDNARTTTLDKMLGARLGPVFVDITPPLNGIDGGVERLSACRAIVPGLVPMSFGWGREPRGMSASVHPGSHFPHPFP